MPTVRIFGQEVERKHLLIGGGLLAAAVAVIVFLRSRATASQPTQEASEPQQDYGYGGMSVGAPTQQVADQYQQQLQNAELEAQGIANQYQRNLVNQQEKQFSFQNTMQEMLAPEILAYETQRIKADTVFERAKEKIPIACPPGYARARDTEGNLTCNPKGSGNKIVKAAENAAADVTDQAIRQYASKQLGLLPKPKAKVVQKVGQGYQEATNEPRQKVGTGGYRASHDDTYNLP